MNIYQIGKKLNQIILPLARILNKGSIYPFQMKIKNSMNILENILMLSNKSEQILYDPATPFLNIDPIFLENLLFTYTRTQV
jgi:hypothetical protein